MNVAANGRAANSARQSQTQPMTQDGLTYILRAVMPGAVAGLAILAVLYTLYFASDLFLPVFFAIFLSLILRPLVMAMKRIGIPKTIGALIVLIGMIAGFIGGIVNLSTPAEKWLHRLPSIQRDIELKLWPVTQSINQAKEATAKIQKLTDGKGDGTREQEVTIKTSSFFNRAFESTWLTFVQILIVVVLTFFLLTQNDIQTKRSLRWLPWLKNHDAIEDVFETVQKTITRFLRISAGVYVTLGVATTLVMYLLGMPNPALWGVLAAILGFMPYVGPIIVFGCIGIVSLLTFDLWWQIMAPPFAYGFLTIIEGNLITPAILGRQLKLNPIAVFLSMLLWTWVWGISGALLAVPILVIIDIVGQRIALIARSSENGPSAEYAPDYVGDS